MSNIYDGDFLQKQLTACNIKEEISELAFSSEFWKKRKNTITEHLRTATFGTALSIFR